MDALALLCNLYGDGPATLKRLRVGGVLRIEDLSDRPAKDLAALLALTPATARRFLKEASTLSKRVLVAEEDLATRTAPREKKRPVREVVRGKEAILGAAARRWEELERTSSHEPEAAPPIVRPAAPATPLAAVEFDRATHCALENAGVKSLEELIAAESETLAHAADLGLSQVLFAQALARRKTREASLRTEVESENLAVHVLHPPARAGAQFSPSERPPAEFLSVAVEAVLPDRPLPPDEGAGPFA